MIFSFILGLVLVKVTTANDLDAWGLTKLLLVSTAAVESCIYLLMFFLFIGGTAS